ncbi:MAG TPA: hypothetical protein VGN84_11215 [Solirubrobacterales bacterium]|jgi:hypothetical protein|nr:hypothetical protein [Solirubrobacterales bacterium]
MSIAPDQIAERLSEIIADRRDSANDNGYLEDYDAKRIVTRARAAIRRFAPPGSAYEDEATAAVKLGNESWKAGQLTAIVHALRDDYRFGGLASVQEIVHADLFDDFLGMADELLAKGFIGPAAVLAGTVLEEQLGKLTKKHGIDTTDEKGRAKSVEALGVDLRKADVITEVQRKSVTAWYAQRTEGAHGRPGNLNDGEVERMIDGIRDFVARYPA